MLYNSTGAIANKRSPKSLCDTSLATKSTLFEALLNIRKSYEAMAAVQQMLAVDSCLDIQFEFPPPPPRNDEVSDVNLTLQSTYELYCAEFDAMLTWCDSFCEGLNKAQSPPRNYRLKVSCYNGKTEDWRRGPSGGLVRIFLQ